MKRILVGHDGSEAANAAYKWASRIARAVDAELVVATVIDEQAYGRPQSVVDELREGMASTLAGWCERVPDAERSPHENRVVIEGSAGRALRDLAKTEQADLIVVGAHRPVGISPWMGSTANDIVHRGTMPIAVIPAGDATITGRFIVGIDGSDESLRALRYTVELAEAMGGTIHAVRAFAPQAEWVARTSVRSFVHAATEELEGWVGPVTKTIPVTTRLVAEHHPVTVLCDEAERVEAEMIAVGTRGVGGFPGMRLGGTTMSLFHHAPYPLLIVPPAQLD